MKTIGAAKRLLPRCIRPAYPQMRLHMRRLFDVVQSDLEVPFLIDRRSFHSSDEDIRSHAERERRHFEIHPRDVISIGDVPGDVVNQLGLQQKVFAGQQKVADVVLGASDGDAVTHAERAQDVQHFRIPAVFLQERDDYFDVLVLKCMRTLRKNLPAAFGLQRIPTLIMFKASGESMRTQWSTSSMPVPSPDAWEPSRLKSQFRRFELANSLQLVWLPLIIAAGRDVHFTILPTQPKSTSEKYLEADTNS